MAGVTEQTRRASEPDADSPASHTRRTSTLAVYAGVLVLFVVAMLSASLAGLPAFIPPKLGARPLPPPEPIESQTINPGPPPQSNDDSSVLMIVLASIVALIVVAVLISGAVWLIRLLLNYLRNRRPKRRPGTATDGDIAAELVTEQTVDEPTIRRGISAARTAVSSHLDVGDAIVAAWIGLEETAADSGTGRGVSETPSEFTLRILLRRPGIEQPARRLLALYESVRFGGRIGDERMREEAQAALDAIEDGWR